MSLKRLETHEEQIYTDGHRNQIYTNCEYTKINLNITYHHHPKKPETTRETEPKE